MCFVYFGFIFLFVCKASEFEDAAHWRRGSHVNAD